MSRPRVYVTRRLPAPAMERLAQAAQVATWPDDDRPPPREVLVREAAASDGLVVLVTDLIDGALLDAAPRVRVVSNVAVGYDNVDVPAATARGVVVTNTPGVLTETTADFAFALLLAAARRVAEADRFTRAGRWTSWGPLFFVGRDVYGQTLGLVGLGRIGTAVARRARGFGMRVLYHSRTRKPEAEQELDVAYVGLEELLRRADFVSIHVPLSEETRHLIGAPQLRLMKPTAILVNTSRGAVVDQRALYEALARRQIWAAGLDVFEVEPIAPDDPLLALDNVVVAPHIGSASVETRTKMALMAVENCLAALDGRQPPHMVNPEVWERHRGRRTET
ncbi:MAG: D-glycerate dehydrogenase [Armatimonadota bacterium]|nr:D-glycerate dehydrogenase [Armatimonadota bacterium]MDR7485218.1 D-glycerate dehydrogenase [Armatimonadota bacterium]MDR7534003.1 D-glycerate dehydrogenase [Armatimonadota bacterium]MDR7536534.1 D-glycerate dehydrogenase [Armatimonadota bacterium]